MINILIFGAGAQVKYILDILRYYPEKKIINIVDIENNPRFHRKEINGTEILSGFNSVTSKIDKSNKVILAYSDNKKKERFSGILEDLGFEFESVIHPNTVISESAKIGKGVIINPNVTIMPFAKIGNHVMIHSNVVIEHDNVIEDYVNIAPGATLAGYVTVKKGAYIYTGVSIIPKVVIGSYSIIGAGATVINTIPDNCVAVGTPARVIKKLKKNLE